MTGCLERTVLMPFCGREGDPREGDPDEEETLVDRLDCSPHPLLTLFWLPLFTFMSLRRFFKKPFLLCFQEDRVIFIVFREHIV